MSVRAVDVPVSGGYNPDPAQATAQTMVEATPTQGSAQATTQTTVQTAVQTPDKARILTLPDEVLTEILEMATPALGYTCRRLYRLFDDIARRELVRRHGATGLETAHALVKRHRNGYLGKAGSSWRDMLRHLDMDWCFYGPQHIVNLQDGQLSEARSLDELPRGTWNVLHGNEWGPSLHASNVLWLMLQYKTALAPGKYAVHINVRVPNYNTLIPIRFHTVQAANVRQLSGEFPPHGLRVQPEYVEEYTEYLEYRPVEICVGLIDVLGPAGSLQDVVFEIEDMGINMNRNITFNYLYFERIERPTSLHLQGWYLWRRRFHPDADMRAFYEDYLHLKGVSDR